MTQIKFSEIANNVLQELSRLSKSSKVERSLYNSIKQKIELLKENPHYGELIRKEAIPEKYIKEYDTNILFKIRLPNFWRMIYTITKDGNIEIIIFILDIVDHKKYNKLFKK